MPYSIWMNRIQRFLYDVVEPYLRIFRRFIPPLAPLDISPIVAIFALWIVSGLVIRLLGQLDWMGLAPTEIGTSRSRGLRGYRRGAVERLLDEIADSYENVWRDRASLGPGRAPRGGAQRHRELESLLRKTLVSAEAAADEQREQARRNAEPRRRRGAAEARRITFAATAERERLLKDIRRLRELLRTALATVDETEGADEIPDEAAAA